MSPASYQAAPSRNVRSFAFFRRRQKVILVARRHSRKLRVHRNTLPPQLPTSQRTTLRGVALLAPQRSLASEPGAPAASQPRQPRQSPAASRPPAATASRPPAGRQPAAAPQARKRRPAPSPKPTASCSRVNARAREQHSLRLNAIYQRPQLRRRRAALPCTTPSEPSPPRASPDTADRMP